MPRHSGPAPVRGADFRGQHQLSVPKAGGYRHPGAGLCGQQCGAALRLDFTLADKGTGLRQLCAALQIPLRDVAAFGDNYNDVPMLELAGTAYLMEGAAAELKARFPRHCAQVVPELARLADALPPRI